MSLKMGRLSLRDRFPDMVSRFQIMEKQQEFLKKEAFELSIDDFVEKHGVDNLKLWWVTNKIERRNK